MAFAYEFDKFEILEYSSLISHALIYILEQLC